MIYMLIGHVLGDFYFQNNKLAKAKKTSLQYVMIHNALYGIGLLMGLLMILVYRKITMVDLYCWVILWILHGVIDTLKYFLGNKNKLTNRWTFIVDQILHIMSILVVTHLLGMTSTHITLKFVLMMLLVGKPGNILLLLFINRYDPIHYSNKQEKSVKGAGMYIGISERLLFIIFLATNNFTGIPVVLSIKAFARYKKVVDEPIFAEYFAIGTFTSLLITLIIYYGITIYL